MLSILPDPPLAVTAELWISLQSIQNRRLLDDRILAQQEQLLKLLDADATAATGQRIVAGRWDMSLPADEAARASSRVVGWPELSADVIWPGANRE